MVPPAGAGLTTLVVGRRGRDWCRRWGRRRHEDRDPCSGYGLVAVTRLVRVVRYRFATSFARTWGGALAIVLLIGLTGGIALASIAGARRTQSSYPKFLASTDPSDLTVSSFGEGGATVASLKRTIARIPGVQSVATVDIPPFALVTGEGSRMGPRPRTSSWWPAPTGRCSRRIASPSSTVAWPIRPRRTRSW